VEVRRGRRRMAEMVKPVLDQLCNYIIVDIGKASRPLHM
jgi:hypothetical protein